MYGVDLYGRVRLAVLGRGISQREAARRFGIDRGNGFEDVGAFGAALAIARTWRRGVLCLMHISDLSIRFFMKI